MSESGIDVLFVYFQELVDNPLENVMKIANYTGFDADCERVLDKKRSNLWTYFGSFCIKDDNLPKIKDNMDKYHGYQCK